MKKIIIGIHGLGNKPSPALLLRWWKKAMLEGQERIDSPRKSIPFKNVYWADILHDKSLKPWIWRKDHPLYLEERYFPSENLPRPEPPGWRSSITKYIEQQLDKVFLTKDMTLNYAAITDRIIRHYFAELEIYFSGKPSLKSPSKPARELIHERLLAVLRLYKEYDILLISHSMGSIVAYDVLTAAPDDIKISTLVTIGSPLGLPVVVSKIFGHQKKMFPNQTVLRTPENVVNKWYNLSDSEDKIALDHTLADDYQPNHHGVKAQDLDVYNDYRANGERNPHKSYGYLRTPELAKIIDEFLGVPKEKKSLKEKALDFLGLR